MNSYIERVLHYSLEDGDYSSLLQYCIDAAVNLMISFPDVTRDENGGFLPFEESDNSTETVHEIKKYFGNRNTGIEVKVSRFKKTEATGTGIADRIIAETYGLPDRSIILVNAFRASGESKHNRIIELHLTAPQLKAAALIELFKERFDNSDPDEEKINSLKKDALLKLDRGEWISAAESAGYILKHRTDDSDALVILGSANVGEGDWRNGRRNLLRSIEFSPENPDAWYNLGLAYMKGSDSGSALHCFEKTLEYDPQRHAAYYMQGVILEETDRTDEAVAAYRYAVKYSPGTHKRRMNRAGFFTHEAVEALERLGTPWRGDEYLPDPEGVDINEDLIRAASAGDVRSIGRLLKKGAFPDYRSHDNAMHGRTPIIAAALNGHIGAVKYLLEHGAVIDFSDEKGATPLGSVIEWSGEHDMIRFLVEHGADVNGKDPYGRALILNERAIGDPVILKILTDAGADLNVSDEDGASGIYLASSSGRMESAVFFIEHGADINSRGRGSSTPVMAAVLSGNHEMLRFLLDKGGSPDIPDYEGRTPLMAASEKSDPGAVALLIAAGADVNARDSMGRSAMDIILDSGRRDDMEAFRKCVDLLTDAGAELLHGK